MVSRDNKEARDFVLHTVKEKGVKFIRLWFTDIVGNLNGFAITVEELRSALEWGKAFDGSSMQGFARSDESDMIALPDPSTFTLLPWRPKEDAVAKMFCDILLPDGTPFEGDSRYVLKKNLKRAANLGYTYYVGPELEFFYFKSPKEDPGAAPQPPLDSSKLLDKGGYFDQTSFDLGSDLRRETVLTLEKMGIPVEYSHHEVAHSQHEIDLRYADGLSMADSVMTFRTVVKQVAKTHGVYATFMPKPVNGLSGSGLHVYQSLFEGDRNAFYDAEDPSNLSDTAKHFLAGLLKYAPEITLATNQWINSYKRLVAGYEAPVYVSWARRNRSDLVRIPDFRTGREDSTRIEYRAPDPACNPYLAFSAMLAAGLEGIERKLDPPAQSDEDVTLMTEEQRRSRGVVSLPRSLGEAITVAQTGDTLRKALGTRVFETLVRNKKIEWDAYQCHVHEYELDHYLPKL